MMTLRRAVLATVAPALLAVGVGCETKSFVDPSEVGRFERTPLVVPILDKLLVGVEGDELRFTGAREVSADDLKPVEQDARIGPNDLLQVTIQDLVATGSTSAENKRVSESGRVSLPNLGPVTIAGLTEAEAEDAIVKAYADAQILPKAIVSVNVLESQNRIYTISGSVNQQGAYPLTRGDFRLLDAISSARGLSSDLGIDYVYIIRKKPTSAGSPTPTSAPTPGAPGVDPLAPTSRLNGHGGARNVALMVVAQDPVVPDAGAAASQPATPNQGAAAGSPPMPEDATRDRVIQIEGAGTQPANGVDPMSPTMNPPMTPPSAGATPGVTTAPPAPGAPYDPLNPTPGAPGAAMPPAGAAAGQQPFEFTAPAEPTDQEVIKVPYTLLKNGELKYNVVVRAQDLIYVPSPPIGEYYMAAHSARPGVYSLSARNITLKQAVISAGGMDQLAIPARTDIIRRLGRNQEVFVRVDLERIFAGLEPDFYLKPDDQVIIGTNIGAPFLAAIRNAFRITYGFGFLYDRNYAPQQTQQ